MNLIKHVFLTSLLLVLAPLAFGHGAESAPANQHGGLAVKAGGYNLELVVDGPTLNLYVNDDHNAPLDVSGAEAEVVILANKKKTKLVLGQKEGNLLSGQRAQGNDEKMKVIVFLKMPGAKKVTARFTPFKER